MNQQSAAMDDQTKNGRPKEQDARLVLGSGVLAVLLNEVRDGVLVMIGLIPIVAADVVTEYRAGTYIYNDRSLVNRGLCTLDDCALSVVATVVVAAGSETQRMLPDAAGPETRARQERRAFVRGDTQDGDIGIQARNVGLDRDAEEGRDAGEGVACGRGSLEPGAFFGCHGAILPPAILGVLPGRRYATDCRAWLRC